jgi:hypothetical protein
LVDETSLHRDEPAVKGKKGNTMKKTNHGTARAGPIWGYTLNLI